MLHCVDQIHLLGKQFAHFWFTFPKFAGQATIGMLSSGVYLFYEMTFMKFCLSLK